MSNNTDTLYRVKTTVGFGGNNPRTQSFARAYHTDEDCQYIKNLPDDRITETTQREVDLMDLTECQECADEKEYEFTKQTCPFCEEEVGALPSHLLTCDDTP